MKAPAGWLLNDDALTAVTPYTLDRRKRESKGGGRN